MSKPQEQPEISTLQATTNNNTIKEILFQCALEQSIPAQQVIETLESLDTTTSTNNDDNDNSMSRMMVLSHQQDYVAGTFELIFSSAVAQLPVVGSWLDGYLPNKETIQFDFEQGKMTLNVETLPFLPPLTIVGEDLTWQKEEGLSSSTLSYKIQGKDTTSYWKILYADETVVAGKSSVTGLNVIRRIVE
jgi:hypothetical protein